VHGTSESTNVDRKEGRTHAEQPSRHWRGTLWALSSSWDAVVEEGIVMWKADKAPDTETEKIKDFIGERYK
jgi:hypothetical protein